MLHATFGLPRPGRLLVLCFAALTAAAGCFTLRHVAAQPAPAGQSAALAQTSDIVWTEDFETDGLGARYAATESCSDGDNDYFTRTDGSDIAASNVYSAPSGAFFWAAQDVDGAPCTQSPQTLTFTTVSVPQPALLEVSALFAEDAAADSLFDWDPADSVRLEARLGAGPWEPVLAFEAGSASQSNQPARQDTDFDGVGDGPALTGTFSRYTATLSAAQADIGAALSVTLRLVVALNAGDEDVAIDSVRLAASTVDLPPVVMASDPAPGAFGVPTATMIAVSFSEPITTTGSLSTLTCAAQPQPLTPVGGTADVDLLTLAPANSLPAGAPCAFVLPADGVVDGAGQSLSADYTISFTTQSAAPPLWINEFHYDNVGSDVGEFVELAGVAGLPLDGWQLVLYDGADGVPYRSETLAGTVPALQNGFGVVSLTVGSLQNGAPDGLALVDPAGAVPYFLAYEGTFTATAGPATGMVATTLDVEEGADTPAGYSLQLVPLGGGIQGDSYDDFAWAGPAPASPGLPNDGQLLAARLGSMTARTPAAAAAQWLLGAALAVTIVTAAILRDALRRPG